MKRLPNDIDIHTHAGAPRPGVIVNIDPTETVLPTGDGRLSVGIHPWNADRVTDAHWTTLESSLADPRVVAIGETGIDRAKGPDIETQKKVFERQIAMADKFDIPLIIHCVRATDILLALRKKHNPRNQWIFHGFRGKPEQAAQLLAAGIDLSFGNRYNTDALDATPLHRRYHESDQT